MKRYSNKNRTVIALACAALVAAAGSAAFAEDTSDTTLLLTERLFQRVVSATKDKSISENAEAGQVITALRSCRDPGLLPIFDKMRQSKVLENQIYAMTAESILKKDAGLDPEKATDNEPDFVLLYTSKDSGLTGSVIASLIDAQALSNKKLKELLATSPDAPQKSMAAGELNRRKMLDDHVALNDLLKSDKPIVRYYTAVTLLDSKDPTEVAAAVKAMQEMTAEHDPRQAPVQALMTVRIQKEKLSAGLPWILQVSRDENVDEGLRYTAIAAALSLNSPEALPILADMINKQRDALQQVKLALIATEYGGQLNKEMLAPLIKSKSSLGAKIGAIAAKAVDKQDIGPDLVELIKEGHPIVLDWALNYSDRCDPDRRLLIRNAIVNQATIVDNVRDQDYERAAVAAEKLLEEDGAAGRDTVAALLASNNRAVVDATLSGVYRSNAKDQSELVLKIWNGLTKTTSTESSANFAAIILAREGHKEALTWLPGMVAGGTLQGPGFRALAGWYYAKLRGQTDALIKAAIAD